MKLLSISLASAWAISTASYGQYSEQVRQWPQVRLQLSQEVTVSDLFAPGLRPYLRPNAENRCVYAKHAHITVVDREGRVYPSIPTDILRTGVLKPWLIGTMEIWTPPLTINEARAEMLKWLPITGRTEQELNDFLRAVEADWLHYDVVNGFTDVVRFADGWREKDGPKKTIVLMKSWQWQAPLRLSFQLDTSGMPSRKQLNLYDGPIPPPPGFENADMTAPKDWEVDTRFIPLTTEPRPAQGTLPPEYQAMNDKAEAETKRKALVRTQLNRLNPFSTGGPGDEPALPWVVLLIAIAAVSGIVWAVMKRRKG